MTPRFLRLLWRLDFWTVRRFFILTSIVDIDEHKHINVDGCGNDQPLQD